jgi:hypothetical protein
VGAFGDPHLSCCLSVQEEPTRGCLKINSCSEVFNLGTPHSGQRLCLMDSVQSEKGPLWLTWTPLLIMNQ